MNKLLIALSVLCLAACSQHGDGTVPLGDTTPPAASTPVEATPTPMPSATPVATPVSTPVVDTVQPIINSLVTDENEYRAQIALAPLTQGLSCVLQSFTSGDRIQASIAGHNTLAGLSTVATFLYKGSFNQETTSANDGLNVLPAPLRPLYLNLYLLRCTGQIVVPNTGYYSFEISSDDGSLLYIDGSKLLDADNNHGPTLVSGQKFLRKGIHAFRLDYAQSGGGSEQLILTSGGVVIDGKFFYH